MSGYDFIVVGGGSAGCVVAARLSEDPSARVLLLEAGTDNNTLMVNMPLGLGTLSGQKNKHNWHFLGEPEPHLNNRQIYCPRGRGLGGSSAINGMLYVRGNSRDYDQWSQLGLRGWSYEDVLPFFKKSEDHADGASPFHGKGGPLGIVNADESEPLGKAVIAAGIAAGYPYTSDFNGAQQEGFGWYDFNVKRGRRGSSSAMFLEPAQKRRNLTVITGAWTTRLLTQSGRVTGVEYVEEKGGETKVAHCDGEVILSSGVIQSPHILQLSGIGDPARLAAAGISVTHELPGVGANLHDHLDVGVGNECPLPVAIHSRVKGMKAIVMGMRYILTKSGPGAAPFMNAGCFIKSRAELDQPDMQLVFVPALVKDRQLQKTDAFTFHMCNLRPESRGFVDARSADPFDAPKILFNFNATENDRQTMRACVKVSREIIAQNALTPYRGKELLPGAEVQTDADIDAWVRAHADTVYHPVGSCKMGVDSDPLAVCDNQLRVRGLDNLRVADASVMPTIVGGNTNAPAMMIGEKCADLIRSGRSAAQAA